MIRSITTRAASLRARAALASATCSVARAIADTSASDSLCPLTSIENSRQKASEQKAEKRKRLLSDCQLHCAYCLLLTAYFDQASVNSRVLLDPECWPRVPGRLGNSVV